eukprot:4467173-Pleurochrysis_carterae.AAC.5
MPPRVLVHRLRSGRVRGAERARRRAQRTQPVCVPPPPPQSMRAAASTPRMPPERNSALWTRSRIASRMRGHGGLLPSLPKAWLAMRPMKWHVGAGAVCVVPSFLWRSGVCIAFRARSLTASGSSLTVDAHCAAYLFACLPRVPSGTHDLLRRCRLRSASAVDLGDVRLAAAARA